MASDDGRFVAFGGKKLVFAVYVSNLFGDVLNVQVILTCRSVASADGPILDDSVVGNGIFGSSDVDYVYDGVGIHID